MGENSRGGCGLLLYAREAGGLDCFQDRMIPCRACARRHPRLVGWMLEDRGWDSLDWTHVKEQIFLRPGRNGMWHWLRCRAGRLLALKDVIYTFLHVRTHVSLLSFSSHWVVVVLLLLSVTIASRSQRCVIIALGNRLKSEKQFELHTNPPAVCLQHNATISFTQKIHIYKCVCVCVLMGPIHLIMFWI